LLDADAANLIADQFSVRQNGPAETLDVLANDQFGAEYLGAREITSVSFGSEGGRVEIAHDRRSIRYAPPADFSGVEQFSYFVDGQHATTVNINVVSPLKNDRITLNPDGQAHTLNVMDNDPFWAGYDGPRRITLLSVTSGEGEVSIGPDGRSVIFQTSPATQGTEEFIYIVDGTYAASVQVDHTVPLRADEYEILQNAETTRLDVLRNDPFWQGYSGERKITFAGSSQTNAGATIEISSDGTAILYTPAENHFGYDSFWYAVDGKYEQTVSISIAKPTQNDWFEVDQDSKDFSIDVLGNDGYWSMRSIRFVDVVDRVTSVDPVSEMGGTVAVSANGSRIIYSAPDGFTGTDTFEYIADGRYPATVTVQVTRPVRDDFVSVYQDTPNQMVNVRQNDFLGNGYQGPKVVTSVSDTEQNGTLTLADGTIRYTPEPGYTGMDGFQYTVDGDLTANVRLYVEPLARSDYYHFCVSDSGVHTLPVLENDHFRRGYTGPGRITAAEIVDGNGTVSIVDGRQLAYRPGSSVGTRISYTVDDTYTTEAYVTRNGHLQSDQFVVDQNRSDVSMNVLSNDFQSYAGDQCQVSAYNGARRITEVRGSEQGGTVTVSADGRSVVYSAPVDFYGSDQFTYVVDGTMEATATVNVVRRVRDDAVRVDAGTTETLQVLVNDLFGADYRGAQQITAVTGSEVGASVTISPDGRELVYSAPAGFEGTDTLTYTVDGKLKAKVDVTINSASQSIFPTFDSLDAFQQFLLEDAVKRYEHLFGQTQYGGGSLEDGRLFTVDAALTAPRDHSETNVQVAGIDEADIVEFDSDYVYMLTGNDVVILDAWPASELHEVSRYTVNGVADAMYLNDNRLTVISTTSTWPDGPIWPGLDFQPVNGAIADIGADAGVRAGAGISAGDVSVADKAISSDARFSPWYWPGPISYETIVTVLDVTDRTAPKLVQETTLEGRYIESRAIGDFVYVAVTNDAVPPEPITIPLEEQPAEGTWGPTARYESKEEYVARVTANLGEFIDATLPNYTSVGANGQVVRSGLMHEPEDIYRPLSEGAQNLVSLVSINVANAEPGLTGSSAIYTNGASQVYASLDHFYVFENGYHAEDGSITRVLQFNWDASSGSSAFAATGIVPGYMLNQFSADEYDNHLRIVTTVSHSHSGNWSGRAENDLFVLHDDGGILEFVGSLQNVGLGQQAQSVRFMGPRAFLVTFQNVDPLFGIDLSDPTNPQAVGSLTLPGFSSYMQFIGEDRLLTVGRNTPRGFAGPAQVSLYDVSDLTRPRLIDEHTFERFSHTEAAVDHHAFGYFAAHGLLAVPSVRTYVQRTDEDQDGYAETRSTVTEHELMVLRIDADAAAGSMKGIELLAQVVHDTPVRRSGYIGDVLYSIAEDSVHALPVNNPQVILATADDLKPQPPVDPDPNPDPPVVLPMAGWFRTAQQDLAARLSVAEGASMPVVAEPLEGGWQAVLRMDDQYFRYVAQNDSLQLTNVSFDFAGGENAPVWQNPVLPADVNGDGHVAPSDALMIFERIHSGQSSALPTDTVLRQISASGSSSDHFWDVNGDGSVSPVDALLVVNQLNAQTGLQLDTGSLDADHPDTLSDADAVDQLFQQLQQTAGDANLDGVFDSSDLVQMFQRGLYEVADAKSATWADGDWNGDRRVTTADLVLAFIGGGYQQNRPRASRLS
jgi:uncharacterized secreted protein with C-terminal beta-propeller domain